MKTNILIIISILFTAIFLHAQENNKDDNKAEITFEKTEYNYGTIELKSDGNCKFFFKNTGKSPVILSNVKSSCGCTVPKWPKEPIMPKQKGEIDVAYNTSRVGKFQKSITVYSNAKNSPVVLIIKGEVVRSKK